MNNLNTEDPAAALTQLEGLLGLTLPEDYRTWLMDPDAPYPAPIELWIPDDNPWIDSVENFSDVHQLLADMTLEAELNAAECRDYPPQTIAIADNELGDHYLLSLRQGDFGAVYYMFHETCYPEEENPKGLYKLAPSFREWLASLVLQSSKGRISSDDM